MCLVEDTLAEWRRGAFVYGQSDCMLSIGRYLARAGLKDVTGLFLSRYDDEAGALAQMGAHGGVAGLIAMTGAKMVDDHPARGDVLELAYGADTIGALCTGDAVAIRLDRGMIEIALRFAKWRGVWRVE